MPSVSDKLARELRAAFRHAVSDDESEELHAWLVGVAALMADAAPHWDLLDATDPGWVELWRADSSAHEALAALAAVDLDFEDCWDFWLNRGARHVG